MDYSMTKETAAAKQLAPGASNPEWLARVPRPLVKRAAYEAPAPKAVAPEQDAEDARLPRQPVVVSVRKSTKGCARVLLRDAALVDRCVLQRVAVVDGVCMEMKRHTSKSRGDEPEEFPGLFVAWGIRVERKFTITEEGLKEYFNNLAGTPVPDGLVAAPPFQEGHVSFQLASEGFLPLDFDIRAVRADADKLLKSHYCDAELIEAQWAAKKGLEDLWNTPPPPMARSLITQVARSQLFPHSGKGGDEHENRAGDKFAELVEVTGLFDGIPSGSAFLDLCGGPGAWSQYLLRQKQYAFRGFGFTLKAATGDAEDWQADTKDEWYDDLYENPSWTALWGKDGTGDLLKPGNLEHTVKALAQKQLLLVVADGGFSDKDIPPNMLELYFYRLFLAEVLLAVSVLKQGGNFVCKLYSSFSAYTAAILHLTTQVFESVRIVKPLSSKTTGPERYLSASGFKFADPMTATIRSALLRSHNIGGGASPLVTPLLSPVVSEEQLKNDVTFTAGMKEMVSTLCVRQTQALNAVVDRTNFLEKVAMASGSCTDPWSEVAQERRAQELRDREERHAEKYADRGPVRPRRYGDRRR